MALPGGAILNRTHVPERIRIRVEAGHEPTGMAIYQLGEFTEANDATEAQKPHPRPFLKGQLPAQPSLFRLHLPPPIVKQLSNGSNPTPSNAPEPTPPDERFSVCAFTRVSVLLVRCA